MFLETCALVVCTVVLVVSLIPAFARRCLTVRDRVVLLPIPAAQQKEEDDDSDDEERILEPAQALLLSIDPGYVSLGWPRQAHEPGMLLRIRVRAPRIVIKRVAAATIHAPKRSTPDPLARLLLFRRILRFLPFVTVSVTDAQLHVALNPKSTVDASGKSVAAALLVGPVSANFSTTSEANEQSALCTRIKLEVQEANIRVLATGPTRTVATATLAPLAVVLDVDRAATTAARLVATSSMTVVMKGIFAAVDVPDSLALVTQLVDMPPRPTTSPAARAQRLERLIRTVTEWTPGLFQLEMGEWIVAAHGGPDSYTPDPGVAAVALELGAATITLQREDDIASVKVALDTIDVAVARATRAHDAALHRRCLGMALQVAASDLVVRSGRIDNARLATMEHTQIDTVRTLSALVLPILRCPLVYGGGTCDPASLLAATADASTVATVPTRNVAWIHLPGGMHLGFMTSQPAWALAMLLRTCVPCTPRPLGITPLPTTAADRYANFVADPLARLRASMRLRIASVKVELPPVKGVHATLNIGEIQAETTLASVRRAESDADHQLAASVEALSARPIMATYGIVSVASVAIRASREVQATVVRAADCVSVQLHRMQLVGGVATCERARLARGALGLESCSYVTATVGRMAAFGNASAVDAAVVAVRDSAAMQWWMARIGPSHRAPRPRPVTADARTPIHCNFHVSAEVVALEVAADPVASPHRVGPPQRRHLLGLCTSVVMVNGLLNWSPAKENAAGNAAADSDSDSDGGGVAPPPPMMRKKAISTDGGDAGVLPLGVSRVSGAMTHVVVWSGLLSSATVCSKGDMRARLAEQSHVLRLLEVETAKVHVTKTSVASPRRSGATLAMEGKTRMAWSTMAHVSISRIMDAIGQAQSSVQQLPWWTNGTSDAAFAPVSPALTISIDSVDVTLLFSSFMPAVDGQATEVRDDGQREHVFSSVTLGASLQEVAVRVLSNGQVDFPVEIGTAKIDFDGEEFARAEAARLSFGRGTRQLATYGLACDTLHLVFAHQTVFGDALDALLVHWKAIKMWKRGRVVPERRTDTLSFATFSLSTPKLSVQFRERRLSRCLRAHRALGIDWHRRSRHADRCAAFAVPPYVDPTSPSAPQLNKTFSFSSMPGSRFAKPKRRRHRRGSSALGGMGSASPRALPGPADRLGLYLRQNAGGAAEDEEEDEKELNALVGEGTAAAVAQRVRRLRMELETHANVMTLEAADVEFALALPAEHERLADSDYLMHTLRTLESDRDPPYKAFEDFVELWGRRVSLAAIDVKMRIRDYPMPFLAAPRLTLDGTLLMGTLRLRNEGAKIVNRFAMLPPDLAGLVPGEYGASMVEYTRQPRTNAPKIYHDMTLRLTSTDFTYGQCFQDAIGAWSDVLSRLSGANPRYGGAHSAQPVGMQPSALPWWDVMRLKVHGFFTLRADGSTVRLLTTASPYVASFMSFVFRSVMLISSAGRLSIDASDYEMSFVTDKFVRADDDAAYILSMHDEEEQAMGMSAPAATPAMLAARKKWEKVAGRVISVSRMLIRCDLIWTSVQMQRQLRVRPGVPPMQSHYLDERSSRSANELFADFAASALDVDCQLVFLPAEKRAKSRHAGGADDEFVWRPRGMPHISIRWPAIDYFWSVMALYMSTARTDIVPTAERRRLPPRPTFGSVLRNVQVGCRSSRAHIEFLYQDRARVHHGLGFVTKALGVDVFGCRGATPDAARVWKHLCLDCTSVSAWVLVPSTLRKQFSTGSRLKRRDSLAGYSDMSGDDSSGGSLGGIAEDGTSSGGSSGSGRRRKTARRTQHSYDNFMNAEGAHTSPFSRPLGGRQRTHCAAATWIAFRTDCTYVPHDPSKGLTPRSLDGRDDDDEMGDITDTRMPPFPLTMRIPAQNDDMWTALFPELVTSQESGKDAKAFTNRRRPRGRTASVLALLRQLDDSVEPSPAYQQQLKRMYEQQLASDAVAEADGEEADEDRQGVTVAALVVLSHMDATLGAVFSHWNGSGHPDYVAGMGTRGRLRRHLEGERSVNRTLVGGLKCIWTDPIRRSVKMWLDIWFCRIDRVRRDKTLDTNVQVEDTFFGGAAKSRGRTRHGLATPNTDVLLGGVGEDSDGADPHPLPSPRQSLLKRYAIGDTVDESGPDSSSKEKPEHGESTMMSLLTAVDEDEEEEEAEGVMGTPHGLAAAGEVADALKEEAHKRAEDAKADEVKAHEGAPEWRANWLLDIVAPQVNFNAPETNSRLVLTASKSNVAAFGRPMLVEDETLASVRARVLAAATSHGARAADAAVAELLEMDFMTEIVTTLSDVQLFVAPIDVDTNMRTEWVSNEVLLNLRNNTDVGGGHSGVLRRITDRQGMILFHSSKWQRDIDEVLRDSFQLRVVDKRGMVKLIPKTLELPVERMERQDSGSDDAPSPPLSPFASATATAVARSAQRARSASASSAESSPTRVVRSLRKKRVRRVLEDSVSVYLPLLGLCMEGNEARTLGSVVNRLFVMPLLSEEEAAKFFPNVPVDDRFNDLMRAYMDGAKDTGAGLAHFAESSGSVSGEAVTGGHIVYSTLQYAVGTAVWDMSLHGRPFIRARLTDYQGTHSWNVDDSKAQEWGVRHLLLRSIDPGHEGPAENVLAPHPRLWTDRDRRRDLMISVRGADARPPGRTFPRLYHLMIHDRFEISVFPLVVMLRGKQYGSLREYFFPSLETQDETTKIAQSFLHRRSSLSGHARDLVHREEALDPDADERYAKYFKYWRINALDLRVSYFGSKTTFKNVKFKVNAFVEQHQVYRDWGTAFKSFEKFCRVKLLWQARQILGQKLGGRVKRKDADVEDITTDSLSLSQRTLGFFKNKKKKKKGVSANPLARAASASSGSGMAKGALNLVSRLSRRNRESNQMEAAKSALLFGKQTGNMRNKGKMLLGSEFVADLDTLVVKEEDDARAEEDEEDDEDEGKHPGAP